MAIASSLCLNLSSPCPASKPSTRLIPLEREDKWRKQCMVGMACMVIGGCDLVIDSSSGIAKEMTPLVVVVELESTKVPRWSDKRTCQPWHLNSLETIVPENLPRPSARRRWESVGSSHAKNAPDVKVTVKTVRSRNCFSM